MQQPLRDISDKRYSRYYTYVKPVISDPVVTGYFGLVATLILTAFFIIFAISPTISTILGLTKKIDEQKQLIKTMDFKINSLIAAQENYSQVEPYLTLLNNAFPQTPLPENIVVGTVSSASSSAVSVSSLQLGPADLTGKSSQTDTQSEQSGSNSKSELNIPTTNFAVSVLGGESEVRQFASSLQNLPRIVTLTSMSVGSDQSSTIPNQSNKTADINGSTYYLK